MSVLNWENIANAAISSDPYPHFIVEQAFDLSCLKMLAQDFPQVRFAGLLPLRHVEKKGLFSQLIKDLESQQLKDIIGSKLGMDLTAMPPLITVRGYARQRDGKIHVDTVDKKVSILLYLNEEWQHEAGKLRVLRSGDNIEDYTAEIPPLMGKMFVFKVTDNCWHGHKPLQAERRALMLNYMSDQANYKKHLQKHSRSAVWKKLKSKFGFSEESI
jgi:SM-20-related protein